jgi:hypothetical protein
MTSVGEFQERGTDAAPPAGSVWRAGCCTQPPVLHVIEFWVENRLMVEVATRAMMR